MATVPQGFLRYHVLRLLNEKPMSGSEIVQEIKKQTDGCWKPSPGSIYPLLAWLRDEEYIRKLPEQEDEMKRYTLTEEGKILFENYAKRSHEFPEKFRFFATSMWFQFNPEKTQGLREATRRLATAVWSLRVRLERECSEAKLNEAREALEEAAKKIEGITKNSKEDT